ncbi:MAG TPA: hypothetical protein VHO48_00980 [Anaerolineaceae bacterium]|nr:hypothetical protein [Anaerolineaceae bacterium]
MSTKLIRRRLGSITFNACLCLVVFLAACQLTLPVSIRESASRNAWTIADLRLLQSPDPSEDPGLDLIAASTRVHESDVQIRLDLLDNASIFDYDLYLALDTQPGGAAALPVDDQTTQIDWDWLLIFPANGHPRVVTPDGNPRPEISPRIARDSLQDTVIVSIDRAHFPGNAGRFSFEAFTTPVESTTVASWIGPVSSASQVIRRAPLLLAFWDTLPADTPAQTLRRWDGAHTGPHGGRNGLKHLLIAAADNHVPVTLLDLKTPETLSSLDALGQMDWVRRLAKEGAITLPDVWEASAELPGPLRHPTELSQLGFWPSRFVYGDFAGTAQGRYSVAFTALTSDLADNLPSGLRLIPIPRNAPGSSINTLSNPDEAEIATENGPSLEIREQLLQAALMPDSVDMVVSGGSLLQTAWADADAAGPTLAYFANHPWIQPLDAQALLTLPLPPEPPTAACSGEACPQSGGSPNTNGDPIEAAVNPDLVEAAQNSLWKIPAGPAADLAARFFDRLATPTGNTQLDSLHMQYIGQIKSLRLAADWAVSPTPRIDCSVDADLDPSTAECVMASDSVFAIVDPRGGRMTFAFYRDTAGVHEIIGPASQFSVGISDPSMWKLDLGVLADPNEIPGAFTQPDDPLRPYQAAIDGDRLILTADNNARKIFSFTSAGVRMEYSGPGPVQYEIPLAVEPQARFTQGWATRYSAQPETDGWTWGLTSGIKVR